ncbi:MAG TPA: transcriptional repressor LexA [Orrella sp.]
MANKLTSRQTEILSLIEHAISETGFPPTRAEIAQTLGFKSANAAEDHLRALEKKGYISLTPGASRGIRLLQADLDEPSDGPLQNIVQKAAQKAAQKTRQIASALTLPVIGRVAAGAPILATENVARELAVDPALFDKAPDYILQVRGESMKDIGILDGDLLAVKKTAEARSGQIVVARIDDDVTVKRLVRESNRVVLEAENPDFKPIVVTDANRFAIEGIAVGLIRTGSLH